MITLPYAALRTRSSRCTASTLGLRERRAPRCASRCSLPYAALPQRRAVPYSGIFAQLRRGAPLRLPSTSLSIGAGGARSGRRGVRAATCPCDAITMARGELMWNGLSSASADLFWTLRGRVEPEVRRMDEIEQATGPWGQGGAPAAKRGRTTLTPGWRLLHDRRRPWLLG